MLRFLSWSLVFGGLLLIGLSATSGEEVADDAVPHFGESVDLALRQMGHSLMVLSDDHTSNIAPVKHLADDRFTIEIPAAINYDSLPKYLDDALTSYNIDRPYQVGVKNADEPAVLLGYNNQAYNSGMIACQGRDVFVDCNVVSVTFLTPVATTPLMGAQSVGFLLSGLGLLGMLLIRSQKSSVPAAIGEMLPPTETLQAKPELDEKYVRIGSSKFDQEHQLITVNGGEEKSLTYRETKLLHYLIVHQQQILEREKIVAKVWGEEGVIVGRSLDVFISRLRKILKEDTRLEIKNVHGVGYKLLVKAT